MENYLAELYERDLLKLRDEIKNFKDDYNIWRKTDGISNSAGTLVLHLTGNLNFCIGTKIGNTGYVRNREREFSVTDVPRQELITGIDNLIEVVKTSLTNISQQKLDETYPLEVNGQKSTAYYLVYFHGHLNYHLGQVNYLRRMLEG
ncbi:DUF1572 family protein [Mucilaginibacter sp.]|uniref:DUF1572 family protein n=1 Tax=Mucilaginibacter sp. TaxID=1882438 RepID=UPI0026301F49|nr:DUF1572 family protein [Mucilaginibacter sp.]MDB4920447.1 hypothetical protein [Mucilaginibacter sp.]